MKRFASMNETSKDHITSYLKDVVSVLQQESLIAGEPVGNCDTTNAICHAIEAVFLHDLKGSSIDKNFWSLLKKLTHKTTLAQIAELTQITTDIGKCRAWVRITINDGAIESYLRLIVADTSLLKKYYRPSAYLRDVEKPGILLTYVQGLCEFQFHLSTNSTVLNQWTSTALVLSGLVPYTTLPRPLVSHTTTHRPRASGLTSRNARPYDYEPVVADMLPPSGSDCMSSSQLTQLERDAFRLHNTNNDYDDDDGNVIVTSSPSTPTSLLSHPDFIDPRPDIYRFAYNVTPVSQMSAESAADQTVGEVCDRSSSLPRRARCCEDASADDVAISGSGVFDEPIDNDDKIRVGRVANFAADESSSLDAAEASDRVAMVTEAAGCAAESRGESRGAVDNGDGFYPRPAAETEERITTSDDGSQTDDAYSKSFDQLLKNYSSANSVQCISPTAVSPAEEAIRGISSELSSKEYCISPVDTSRDENAKSSNSERDDERLLRLRICNEIGLNRQSYQCHGCARPIGMLYGRERLCNYDGFYYCEDCHCNNIICIPARIIYNWDFRPYQVCERNRMVLSSTYDEPVIDLDKVNALLYEHVAALHDVLLLRRQLRSLKAYLFSCRQPVAKEFMSLVNEKSYLVDSVHTYSLKDLHHITSGVLASRLKKAVDYGTLHVHNCVLCSQKGFICELCQSPEVIYPFQLSTTARCETCQAVFHNKCKTSLVTCPRCQRRRGQQQQQLDVTSQCAINSPSRVEPVNPVERVSFSFHD